jgi:hypothetical protein
VWRGGYGQGGSEEGSSFLKKRSKRLLDVGVGGGEGALLKWQKFFASFFKKRSAFLTLGIV